MENRRGSTNQCPFVLGNHELHGLKSPQIAFGMEDEQTPRYFACPLFPHINPSGSSEAATSATAGPTADDAAGAKPEPWLFRRLLNGS